MDLDSYRDIARANIMSSFDGICKGRYGSEERMEEEVLLILASSLWPDVVA